jgi:ABC-type microcin C transport system duplicated ATPase subunit YejF
MPPEPSCSLTGSVKLAGVELLGLPEEKLAKVRGGSIAYIFQEPGTSLNPVYTIGFQIGEAVALHRPEVLDFQEGLGGHGRQHRSGRREGEVRTAVIRSASGLR